MSSTTAAEAATSGTDNSPGWGSTRRGLVNRALGNLRRDAATSLRRASDGAPGCLHLEGRHEASLVLLDELCDLQLDADTPTGAMAAIPYAGTLAWCDAAPEGLKALRGLVARAASGGTPTVSRAVYCRRDRRREALPSPPQPRQSPSNTGRSFFTKAW